MLWRPCGGKRTEGGGGSAGRLGRGRPPLFVIRPRIGGPGGLQRSPSAVMGQRGAKAGPCHRNPSSFFYGNPHVLAAPPRHVTAAGKKPRKGRRMLPVDAGLPRSSGKIFFAGRTKRRHNEGPFEKGKPLEKVRWFAPEDENGAEKPQSRRPRAFSGVFAVIGTIFVVRCWQHLKMKRW